MSLHDVRKVRMEWQRQANNGAEFYCSLCNRKIGRPEDISPDHIIPRSLGGSDHLSNLRPTHTSCNIQRGNSAIGVPNIRVKPPSPRISRIEEAWQTYPRSVEWYMMNDWCDEFGDKIHIPTQHAVVAAERRYGRRSGEANLWTHEDEKIRDRRRIVSGLKGLPPRAIQEELARFEHGETP